MSGLFSSERDFGNTALVAAGTTAPATSSAALSRRNVMLLPDTTRQSSPNGSDSTPGPGSEADAWTMPDNRAPATARPRHRLDLNSVSLAYKPDGGTSNSVFPNQMPLPAPALSAPSSTEARVSYVQAPASLPTLQYECADTDKPPPGCAPDAIKLFVGSIPKSCTESQLLPFFETIGKVVDLVVVRDRVTRESKGSAFLWYATRAHAEQAILQFNLRHVLQDPSGEQNRPLVLRRAKSRAKPTVLTLSSPQSTDFLGDHGHAVLLPPHSHDSGGYGGYGAMHQQGRPMSQGSVGQGYQQNMGSLLGQGQLSQGQPGGQRLPPSFYRQGGPRSQEMAGAQTFGADGGGGYNQGGESMGQVLHGSGTGSLGGLDSVMMALHGMHLGGTGHPGGASQQQQQQQQQQQASDVSMSLTLSWPQLSILKDYIHGIQGISGAKLTITAADTPSVFCLMATGMANQVQGARDLLLSVLHRA